MVPLPHIQSRPTNQPPRDGVTTGEQQETGSQQGIKRSDNLFGLPFLEGVQADVFWELFWATQDGIWRLVMLSESSPEERAVYCTNREFMG